MEYEEKKSLNLVAIIVPIVVLLLWFLAWFFSTGALKKHILAMQENNDSISVEKISRAGFPFRRKLIIDNVRLSNNVVYNNRILLLPKVIIDGILFSNTAKITLVEEARTIDATTRTNLTVFTFYDAPNFPKITFVGSGANIGQVLYEDKGYKLIDSDTNEIITDNKAPSNVSIISKLDKTNQLLSINLKSDLNSSIGDSKQTAVVDINFISPTEQNTKVSESTIEIKDLVFDSGVSTFSLEGSVRKKLNRNVYSGDATLKIINFSTFQQAFASFIADKVDLISKSVQLTDQSEQNAEVQWLGQLLMTLQEKFIPVTTALARKNERTSGDSAYFHVGKSQDDAQIFINNTAFQDVFLQLTTPDK